MNIYIKKMYKLNKESKKSKQKRTKLMIKNVIFSQELVKPMIYLAKKQKKDIQIL